MVEGDVNTTRCILSRFTLNGLTDGWLSYAVTKSTRNPNFFSPSGKISSPRLDRGKSIRLPRGWVQK